MNGERSYREWGRRGPPSWAMWVGFAVLVALIVALMLR
jgi:hypothetical protein